MRRELLPLVRDALAGRYTLDREIARGGAAYVYSGQDADGNAVAVKVLRPELAVTVTADRFLREVDFLRKLEHPHVARMLDSGEAEFFLFYVMPMIEGPSLRQHPTGRVASPWTTRGASGGTCWTPSATSTIGRSSTAT